MTSFTTAPRPRLTLDTNILVYAADRRAGRRHEIAGELMGRAAVVDSVLTMQSLGEFFFASTRKGKLAAREARGFIEDWQSVFAVVESDQECLRDALDAVEDHDIAFWDAMLWATARRVGCRLIVTEDFQDGRELGGVWFVNPFGGTPPPRLETALRPDG